MIKRIVYTFKNYDEFTAIELDLLSECDRCKAVMTEDEQIKRPDGNGISSTMVCPKCGCDEFLIFKEVEVL